MIDDRHDRRSASPGGACPRRAMIEARRPRAPGRTVCALAAALLLVAAPAAAQPRRGATPRPPAPAAAPKPAPADKVEPTDAAATVPGAKGKPKVFDFTGLDLAGRLRTPQLLYFLDRASEELERASLERRSFIPAMVRSIDESDL